jgi:hypothetical protein
MPTRIDHVIAGAADFAALENAWTRLGFHITGGGTHPHLGTRNRIIVLGEGYIELLGIADAGRVSPHLASGLTHRGSGWVGFALQSAAIEDEIAAMRERAVDVHGPLPGRLVASDGSARGWHTASIGATDLWSAAEPLPFLIQHDTTGAAHQAELAGNGGLAPHTNGAIRLADVAIATRDITRTAAEFAETYGLRPTDPIQGDHALGATVLRLAFAGSVEHVVLAEPSGEGVAQARLSRAGEGVCALTLAVTDLDSTAVFLRGQGIAAEEVDGHLLVTRVGEIETPIVLVAA